MRHGRRHIVARLLATPEGIVVRDATHLFVIEQGTNRLDLVNTRSGLVRVLQVFHNATGQEGIDGIAGDGHGRLLIPNSPYGTLQRRTARGTLRLVRRGFARPVAALRYAGHIVVADENANAIWLLKRATVKRLATVPTPDDLAVAGGHLYAVTLGDGGLWEIRPRVRRLPITLSDPQGLAFLAPHILVIADGTRNALYRVKLEGC